MAAAGGQSFYYMNAMLIVAWMCGIVLCAKVGAIRSPTLGLISVVIFFLIVARSLTSQYLFFVHSFPEALQYARAIQSAEAEAPVYAESHFFSFRSPSPVVDMGDTVSKVEKTGYYGRAFSALFRANLDRLTVTPPTYVIHSFVDSPEFARIVRDRYLKLLCAPKYFVGFHPPCLYRLVRQLVQ
jgi:hypothetical protein